MDVEKVMREYIDRCQKVIEEKEKISEEHGFSDPGSSESESNQRDYLDYIRFVNSTKKELLADFLNEVSYANLKLLLAIFYCGEDQFSFPEDISFLKESHVKKNKIINTITDKDPEVVVSHLENVLETAERKGIELDQ